MKKGKNIFTILFTILLFVMSFSAVSFYDNIKKEDIDPLKNIEYYFSDEFQYMTMDLAMQLDSSYNPFQFNDFINKKEEDYIKNEFKYNLEDVKNFIHMDKYFFYIAKNTLNNKVITNINNYNPSTFTLDDYGHSIHVQYDANGYCSTNRNINNVFSKFDINNLFDNYEYNNEPSTISDRGISINTPKNVDIQFIFPKKINSFEGLSGYLNSWEHYNLFSTIILCTLTFIIFGFIIFYPIKYVEEINPFKTVKKWSFEINFIIWITVISLSFVSIMVLAGNTINGNFTHIISSFGIDYGNELLLTINIIVWILSLLSIAISIFLIKYIGTYGPVKYLKDHTLIAKLFQFIKLKLNLISEIDLTSPMNATIMKYVLLNGIITIFIAVWNVALSIVFTTLYSLVLFFFIKRKTQEIQRDYNILLSSIKNIISEDFDKISEKDFGIFESSKEELSQLSNNFESAIHEKVKSEKLKTELISNVSHDLKTPLTCIKNYITLLKDDKLSFENKYHYLNQLTLYTNRLKNLIEDLFEISKADSGNINLNIQKLDIVSLLEQVYLENEDLLQSKNLTVVKKYNIDKLTIHMDSDKTYRIFENLFTNINKYALSGSRVYLTLNDMEDHIEIEFNNISEVPMDFTSEEITERFVRGDKSRSKQGSGLGLAIARSFTEAQGGTFKITIDCDLFKVKIILPKNNNL